MISETMEAGDFKDFAKAMTDYIAEYLENIRDRYLFLLTQTAIGTFLNECSL